MVGLLVEGGLVYTMDGARRMIEDGSVAIEGDQVVGVGESSSLRARYSADRVIDASGCAVLPGFVDVHTHLPSIFVRGVYGVVREGLYRVLFPIKKYIEPEHLYVFGVASCIEALNSGITTVQETYNHMDQFAQAAEETGIRANIGEQISEADYQRVQDGEYSYLPEQAEEMHRRALRLLDEWDGAAMGRITTCLAPLAPDMCRPWIYELVRREAEERGALISTHLAQSRREVDQVKRLYGKTPVEHLGDLRILGDNLLAAHCIYADKGDTKKLRESNTRILHCPRPYLLGGTTVPLADWLAMGISVGLGTDNVHHSMWETMRAALYAARIKEAQGGRRGSPGFYELLELATIRGAEMLGMGREVGSLKAGKKADLQIIDLGDPHLTPTIDVTSSLVLYGSTASVKTVIVDGEIVKDDRGVTTVEVGERLSEAQGLCEEIWERLFRDQPGLKALIR
ncbi:MAG: amidohydrolase family protein [Candidatus Bathyarchaeota archaeon]